jgi:hypothetical protein
VLASAVVVAWAVAVDLGASEYSPTGRCTSAWATSSVVLRQSRGGTGSLNTRSVGLEAPLVLWVGGDAQPFGDLPVMLSA